MKLKINYLEENVKAMEKIAFNEKAVYTGEKESLRSEIKKLRCENNLLRAEKTEVLKEVDVVKRQYFGLLDFCNQSKSTIRDVVDLAESWIPVLKNFECGVEEANIFGTNSEQSECSEKPADAILSDVSCELRQVLERFDKVSEISTINYGGKFGIRICVEKIFTRI